MYVFKHKRRMPSPSPLLSSPQLLSTLLEGVLVQLVQKIDHLRCPQTHAFVLSQEELRL